MSEHGHKGMKQGERSVEEDRQGWAGPLPCRFPADFRPLLHSHAEWGSAIR